MIKRFNRTPDPDKKTEIPGEKKTLKQQYSAPAYDEPRSIRESEYSQSEYDEPSGENRRFGTNADEQHKITNADSDPLDEKEREGE